MTCFHHICPDGGIGRRAGLKHQCRKASRFEPESGYIIKAKVLSSMPWLFCFFMGATIVWQGLVGVVSKQPEWNNTNDSQYGITMNNNDNATAW